ncbi:MAG: hypothetical protein QOD29_5981, partial [Alphaproteobacteria bacterium]|nr:hypothetical protein [Alphaproteobacteria bacterium]
MEKSRLSEVAAVDSRYLGHATTILISYTFPTYARLSRVVQLDGLL